LSLGKQRELAKSGFGSQFEKVQVQVVATKSSLHFFDKDELERDHGGEVKVWTDEEEWAVSRKRLR